MSQRKIGNYIANQFMELIQSSGADSVATWSELNDPTILEFIVIPHFTSRSGLLADEKYRNSALSHLKRIGENERYLMLKEFITKFKSIMNECMWMFKTISGVGDAMRRKIHEPSFSEGALSFTSWETIDWRIQSLMSLHKAICYDYDNRLVEVLPKNMREFLMSVYVRDIRVLANDSSGKNLRDFGRTIDTLDIELTAVNHRMFHFGHCDISTTSASSHLDELNTVDTSEVEVSFDITYRTFNESSKFRTVLGDVEIKSSARNIPKNRELVEEDTNLIQNIGNRLSAQAESIVNAYDEFTSVPSRQQQLDTIKNDYDKQIENVIAAKTGGLINRARLGNVYGFDISDVEFFSQLDQASISRIVDQSSVYDK